MKIKKPAALLVLIPVTLLTSGCFSAMSAGGGAWNGDRRIPPQAVGMDILTSPIQVPVFVAAGSVAVVGMPFDALDKKKQVAYRELQARLEAAQKDDPMIGYRERWDLKQSPYPQVFSASFSDQDVHYSRGNIITIYDALPGMHRDIFRSKACPAEILKEALEKEIENPSLSWISNIEALVSNPGTPMNLIEIVAESRTLPVGLVYSAQHAVRERKASENTMPNNDLQPEP